MRYFYKSKNSDFYNASMIDNPFAWILVSFAVSVAGYCAILYGYTLNGLLIDICTVSTITFVAVTTWQVIQVKKYLGSFSNLISYLANYNWVEAIDTAILNSRSSAGMINKSYRVLPKIWIWKCSSASEYKIKIQKLAGTYEDDLDHIAELVSSAIGDKFRVTSKSITQDESWFDLIISPVNQNLLFTPKLITDLWQSPYNVKLQNGLVINFGKLPHLAVFGKTGSGKSTVLWAIILQTIGNSELYFIDIKQEFSILNSFYPSDRFAINADDVLLVLQKVAAILDRRKKIVQKEAQKRGVIGLTGYAMKLTPVYLVIDEFQAVLSLFGSSTDGRKKKKQALDLLAYILMQSRAYSINVLYANQSPSTDILDQKLRSQFSDYILLGSANTDTQRMALGEVATNGDVGNLAGYYLQNTASMTTPQRFEVPDIYKNHLNRIDVFKRLYNRKIGRKTQHVRFKR